MSPPPESPFDQLRRVMQILRSPNGCAWDREQTLESLRPFVLEETYELVHAIDQGDRAALKEELGDVLFETVFLAQICEEEGVFSIDEAIRAVLDKLIRRHPHVFSPDGHALGESHRALTPSEVKE